MTYESNVDDSIHVSFLFLGKNASAATIISRLSIIMVLVALGFDFGRYEV